jgi:hypothetical protein
MTKQATNRKLGIEEIVRARRGSGETLVKIATDLNLTIYTVRRHLGLTLSKASRADDMLQDMRRIQPARQRSAPVSHASLCHIVATAVSSFGESC